jgi:hypothetical protein
LLLRHGSTRSFHALFTRDSGDLRRSRLSAAHSSAYLLRSNHDNVHGLERKLGEHKTSIYECGEEMLEIRDRGWPHAAAGEVED